MLRRRIYAGEVDVVLRVLPMSPVVPSPFAFFLRKGPIPCVIGQLRWRVALACWLRPTRKPEGVDIQPSECVSLSYLRWFDLPTRGGHHSCFLPDVLRVCHLLRQAFLCPRESGIARSLCSNDSRNPDSNAKLELLFVGGLVPPESLLTLPCEVRRHFCGVVRPTSQWSATAPSAITSSSL